MEAIPLRAPRSEDFAAILALNNAHAAELGALTLAELERLIEISFRTRVAESADAFLIAFEQGADYESPNYRWFSARFERFAYVDRVAVAATARKKGLGRLLYRDIIDAAICAGHTRLCCEVNTAPPNPVSDAFHAALGFKEIGRAVIPERGKAVRYLELMT